MNPWIGNRELGYLFSYERRRGEEEMNSSINRSASPDELTKAAKKGDVELTEGELGEASGGFQEITIQKVVDKTSSSL